MFKINKKTGITARKILFLFIATFLIWTVGAKYMSQHEFIHAQIFKRYYAHPITEINYFKLTGKTYIPQKENYKCNEFCKMQHTFNDIVSYNVALFIYFICVIYLIKFAYKKWIENG